MKQTIVVTDGIILLPEQTKRLESLGNLISYKEASKSKEETLERFKDADIICSETPPIEDVLYELKDKFISFPFVQMGGLKTDKLKENKMRISNAPGCNKTVVSEWIIAMMIMLAR